MRVRITEGWHERSRAPDRCAKTIAFSASKVQVATAKYSKKISLKSHFLYACEAGGRREHGGCVVVDEMADLATSKSSHPSGKIKVESRDSNTNSSRKVASSSSASSTLAMASADDSELDIETLTRRILAVLSKYRISQLVFGERVVGCSQGHLHNLLWKPKQFAQLSAHGKRPYYKMQTFLDEEGLDERISQLTSLRGGE